VTAGKLESVESDNREVGQRCVAAGKWDGGKWDSGEWESRKGHSGEAGQQRSGTKVERNSREVRQ
jgi:hypothetical protein